eukprot:SAG31_NODE_1255_length_9082_cov_35.353668_5_plen_394_part_00
MEKYAFSHSISLGCAVVRQDAVEFPLEELRVDYNVLKKQFQPHRQKQRAQLLGVRPPSAKPKQSSPVESVSEDMANATNGADNWQTSPRGRRGRCSPSLATSEDSDRNQTAASAAAETHVVESETDVVTGVENEYEQETRESEQGDVKEMGKVAVTVDQNNFTAAISRLEAQKLAAFHSKDFVTLPALQAQLDMLLQSGKNGNEGQSTIDQADQAEAHKAALKHLFDALDINRDGFISEAEFLNKLRQLKNPRFGQLQHNDFHFMDNNGVGDRNLSFNEWCQGMEAIGETINDGDFLTELAAVLTLDHSDAAVEPELNPTVDQQDAAAALIQYAVRGLSATVVSKSGSDLTGTEQNSDSVIELDTTVVPDDIADQMQIELARIRTDVAKNKCS